MTDNESGAPLPPIEQDPAVTPVPAVEQPEFGAVPPGAEPETVVAGTKPEIGSRVLAYIIDWVIAMVIFAVLATVSGALGSLVGAAYLLLRDGFDFDFMRGRSLGKRMMKVNVVRDDG